MAGLILPTIRTTQPQQAVGINWSNPLAKGLVFVNSYDLNIKPITKNGAVSTTVNYKSAKALTIVTRANTNYISTPKILPTGNTPYTLVQQLAVSSKTDTIGMDCLSQGSNSDGQMVFLTVQNGVILDSWWSATNDLSVTFTPSAKEVCTIASTYDGTTKRLYINGVFLGSKVVSGVAFNLQAANAALCGKRGTNTANGFAGSIAFSATFNRALQQAEIKSLSDNPWQIFAPQPRRLFIVPSAGGAYTLDSNVSNYYLTPFNCDILQNKLLNSTLATINLAGQNSGLLFGRTLNSNSNSFLEVGTDTSLLVNRVVSTTLGSLTLTGNSTDLLVSKVLLSGASSFNLNGLAASLTYTPVGAYILVGDTSSYSFNTQAAGLLYNRIISGTGGSFTLNGLTSNLLKGFNLQASLGSFLEAGLPITLTYNVLTGYTLSCNSNSFTLTALDSSILVNRLLASNLASFTLSGASSILMASGVSVSTAENTWQISIKTLPNSLLIKQLQSNKV